MDIVMPSLAADMEEGTLTQWLVQVGDAVKKGDIIAVIETNKGAIDMEVYAEGVITELCLEAVATVPVGTVMATMDVGAKVGVDTVDQVEHDRAVNQPATPSGERVIASPAARWCAQQEHINLSSINGSGPQGAILLRDLARSAADKTPPDKKPGIKTFDAEAMRRSIAAAMEKSKREIPHYYLSLDIDISSAQLYLQTVNAQREPEQRLLLLALLLRSMAKVLLKFPQLNGYYKNGHFETQKNIHIGNAITLRGGGLVVPAIHAVEQLTLGRTMAALRDLVARTRNGHLRSSELTDATITVTSIGDRGADRVYGVIYPPQVAIVGIGKPQQKALVMEGDISVRDVITVTLSADHRVSDGIMGAKFLNALDNQLQHPDQL